MLEQLSTYIIKSKNNLFVLLCLVVLSSNAVFAVEPVFKVQPLSITKLNYNTYDVYVYGAGSYSNQSNLWAATEISNEYNDRNEAEWYIDIGATLETSWSNVKGLHLCSSIGYKRVKYNYVDEASWNNGVVSDWLSLEINCDYSIVCIGVKSDVLLNSSMINHDDFSYVGFYPNSFNKITLCPFAGLQVRFTKFKIEGRLGYYFLPYLNLENMALNNFRTIYYQRFYWEVRIAARLFTSGIQIKSTSNIF